MEAGSSSDNRRTNVNKQRPRKNNKTFTCSLHFVTIVSIPINIRDWMSFVCVHVRMCKYLSIAPQGWRVAAMSDEESPRPGDRILLFKQENMSLLLQGQKTFDARKVNYRPGRYLLGCNGRIYAVAQFHRAFAVQTQRAWERLRSQHRSFENTIPYVPKTFLFRVRAMKKLKEPMSFRHPRGAVNVVVYRPNS